MDSTYQFDLPKHHKSIIKVIGVGGGGSNAVNHMHNQGIKDVEFVVCNTDAQALKSSSVQNKLQIGVHLTEGLGAGANPEVGMNAALESKEDIRELLGTDTKMIFITAGMGGGTGTGAAPIIAKVASELDVLTVGIVTIPFSFEGKRKMQAAQTGLDELKENCDTVLAISNDKLREVYGNLSIRDAFAQADNVLSTAAKSIAEIITVTSEVNVDFQDVKTVMRKSGPAVMGSATVSGENRAIRAVESALASPLLNNTDIIGAQKILLSITYGDAAELTMDELTEITDYIEEKAGDGADVIFGQGLEPGLEDSLRVTVIATGFADSELAQSPRRKVYDLESNKEIRKEKTPNIDVDNVAPQQYKTEPQAPNSIQEEPPVAPSQNAYVFENPADSLESISPVEPIEEKAPVSPVSDESDDKKVFTLDGGYEIQEKPVQQELPLFADEKSNELSAQELELEAKRRKLIEQSQERIRRLQQLSNQTSEEVEDFKQKLEVPAYKRRNVNLQDVPKAEDQDISRFNLDDDNDILGNNKFLHDNVD